MTFSGILAFAAALFAGGSVFCISYFLMLNYRNFCGAGDGTPEESNYRLLPPTLRLGRPFARFFRFAASGKGLAQMRENVGQKLMMAGLGDVITPVEFVSLRFYFVTLGAVIFLLCLSIQQLLFGLILGGFIALYPGLWLNAVVKARHLSILKALPNLLDLLTLSVEAGKDFVTSLRDILQRRRPDPLGEELMRAFQEIQLGRKRSDALRDLSRRVNQTDLTAVLNAIIQAEELGVSIAQLLRIQGDMLRNKRFTRAEKLANEAPVKIIVPIIAFIFPAVMIVLLGPIAMQALKMFGS